MLRFAPSLWRYKWLILLITAAGAGAGWSVVRLMAAPYEARATILVEADDGQGPGPIRPPQPFAYPDWWRLLRSELVLAPVVTGFTAWAPTAAASERAAVESLAERLAMSREPGAPILRVSLVGSDPERTAVELGAVVDRFILVANGLREDRLETIAGVLEETRIEVERQLRLKLELEERLALESVGVRGIRRRSEEEEALQRRVRTVESFHTQLEFLHKETLQAAARLPKLRLLSPAATVHRSTALGSAASVLFLIILASFCIAIADALLLDWLDRRLEPSYRL